MQWHYITSQINDFVEVMVKVQVNDLVVSLVSIYGNNGYDLRK